MSPPALGALPKIDLHRHLEGSVRPETFLELARETRLGLGPSELRRRTSMAGERPGFRRFLSKFELFRGLYPSREWVERVAFEAAEDARNDGVVYLELRFSPTHFGRRLKAPGEEVAQWVARGARRTGLDVRFIATFGRDFGPEGNAPTTRAVQGTDLFSGIDLAGNESCSALPFVGLFRSLGLPATIHAGELGGSRNVREAIEQFGARRIGHGVRAFGDRRLLEWAHGLGVHFEVCLSSEIQTGAAPSWKRHPAWRALGRPVRFSLNTDDPSISGILLSGEFERARRAGWSRADLEARVRDAAEAAFLRPAERRALLARIARGWSSAAPPENAKAFPNSPP